MGASEILLQHLGILKGVDLEKLRTVDDLSMLLDSLDADLEVTFHARSWWACLTDRASGKKLGLGHVSGSTLLEAVRGAFEAAREEI